MNQANHNPSFAPSPGGAIAVGTPESLDGALKQIELSDSNTIPRPFGVVVLDDATRIAAEAIGMRVLGAVADLPEIHARTPFARAIVSLPSAMHIATERVRETLDGLGVESRFIPTIDDLLGSTTNTSGPSFGTSLDVHALIGRSPRPIDPLLVGRAITGKRVLITGAGGSIGSELARICARFHPESLVLMERAENALFEIDSEIGRRHPDLPRRAILNDVVEPEATLRHFLDAQPQVVFHAAAHKHVPMMETHPGAALNNNLFGTKSVADAAKTCGCERFVLISTDKAVHPSSVMGATKRLAELYIRSLNGPGGCGYSLVRFGNVLGSACSVLPIWSRQLSEGGPITVTHEQMTRYFMTIPEAASLVIQASAIDAGPAGGVFELDMGEPVNICDLAARFVRLHGFVPEFVHEGSNPNEERSTGKSHVRILFTGIRPGEKLHEELAYQAEELRPTEVPGVRAWAGESPLRDDVSRIVSELSALRNASRNETVLEGIKQFVPSIGKTSDMAQDHRQSPRTA